MSTPPEPPERLAEILLEILALSDATRTSQSESDGVSDSIELIDTHRGQAQPQQTAEEEYNRQQS